MPEEPLRPARPVSSDERNPYGPKLPWKWILGGALLIALLAGSFLFEQHRKAEALRTAIDQTYAAHVRPAADQVQRFRAKIEGWVMKAARGGPPTTFVDPRLSLVRLHDARGLYLRLPTLEARTADGIAEGAGHMEPDAIGHCLGVEPVPLRTLYEKGGFLSPAWLKQVGEADGVMRLRVLEDDLARRAGRDLPILVGLTRADYFLLVLQEGKNRRDAPVDVFLWNMRDGKSLLRAHVQAEGVLIPVHIALQGVPRAAAPTLYQGGANDCSIAAKLKALTGQPAPQFDATLPPAPATPPPPALPAGTAQPTAKDPPARGARARPASTPSSNAPSATP